MRSPARCAAWLLPLLLAGCAHFPFPLHKNQPAKAQAFAPPLPSSHPIELASAQLPPAMCIIPAWPIYNMREQVQPDIPPPRRRRPPNKSDESADNPEAPANAPETPSIPAVNAIGELSSGDPADFRRQTENSIASIERGLNGINHPLSDAERKTADNIREDLKQAKAALASGDVDGAHTLAAKAQVLLTELTR